MISFSQQESGVKPQWSEFPRDFLLRRSVPFAWYLLQVSPLLFLSLYVHPVIYELRYITKSSRCSVYFSKHLNRHVELCLNTLHNMVTCLSQHSQYVLPLLNDLFAKTGVFRAGGAVGSRQIICFN